MPGLVDAILNIVDEGLNTGCSSTQFEDHRLTVETFPDSNVFKVSMDDVVNYGFLSAPEEPSLEDRAHAAAIALDTVESAIV